MARGTRTVYPSKRNKGLSSTFQQPEEGWSVQQPKSYDKDGDKDEDNSPKNVNNVNYFCHLGFGFADIFNTDNQILSTVSRANEIIA